MTHCKSHRKLNTFSLAHLDDNGDYHYFVLTACRLCDENFACIILFNPPSRQLCWLCLQNVFRTWHFSPPPCQHPGPSPHLLSPAWLQYVPNWSAHCCPCLSVVYFQHSRFNDAFEIEVSSGQKPTRARYLSQSKIQSPQHGPQNQLLLFSPKCTLGPAHQLPLLSVSMAERSCLRAFARPVVPLPPR